MSQFTEELDDNVYDLASVVVHHGARYTFLFITIHSLPF